MAIRECHEAQGYPIEIACSLLHVARSAYHKAVGNLSRRTEENERLADRIENSVTSVSHFWFGLSA